MDWKDIQELFQMIDRLPEKCTQNVVNSCVEIIKNHTKQSWDNGKCIYCDKDYFKKRGDN